MVIFFLGGEWVYWRDVYLVYNFFSTSGLIEIDSAHLIILKIVKIFEINETHVPQDYPVLN